MIVVKNIHKSFNKLEVLKGVNVSINKGELVAIVGASGAGKSTLLQIIGSIEKSDKGKVEMKGINLSRLNDSKLSENNNKAIKVSFYDRYGFHLINDNKGKHYIYLHEDVEIEEKLKFEERYSKMLENELGIKARFFYMTFATFVTEVTKQSHLLKEDHRSNLILTLGRNST